MNLNALKWGVLVSCAIISACDSADDKKTASNTSHNSSSSASTEPSATDKKDNTDTTNELTPVENTDNNALQVSDIYPAKSANNRALISDITIEFNHSILAESFDEQLLTLSGPGNTAINGVLKQINDTRFTFSPSQLLSPNTTFTVAVSNKVMSQDGLEGSAFSWQFTTTSNVGNTPQAVMDMCMDERDIAMLDSVNNARGQSRTCGNDAMQATTTLSWNCALEQAAQIHSDDMTRNNFFNHDGSDGSSAGDRMQRVGYRFSGWGENIAAGQRTVDSVMAGWLKSPGHCSNIMSSNHQEFGLGYAQSSSANYTHYWTQNFASPANQNWF